MRIETQRRTALNSGIRQMRLMGGSLSSPRTKKSVQHTAVFRHPNEITHARTTLLQIARELILSSQNNLIPNEALSGSAMFLSRLSRQNWINPQLQIQMQNTARVEVSKSRTLDPRIFSRTSLYSGFPGYFWSVLDLARILGEDPAATLESTGSSLTELNHLSRVLQVKIRSRDWTGQFELIQGLAGLGFFASRFWDQTQSPFAKQLLDDIYKAILRISTSSKSDGMTWFTPPNRIPKMAWEPERKHGQYNLGLSHGIPGAIAFLVHYGELGLDSRHNKQDIQMALKWLLGVSATEENASRFPNQLSEDRKPTSSALSWCYGDPGIWSVVWRAGRLLNKSKLSCLALEGMMKRLESNPQFDGIRDSSLCHGRAGAAFLCNWYYLISGDSFFVEQSRRWYQSTFESQSAVNSPLGLYPSYQPKPVSPGGSQEFQTVRDLGFLTGSPGVGLALLCALEPNNSDNWSWIEVLGMLPPPRS